MDSAELVEALRVANAAQRMGCLSSSDWPELAVHLLVEGADDPGIAELAGHNAHTSSWTINPLLEATCRHYGVETPEAEAAVVLLAALLAADLRARPAVVTGPIIRMLATLAPWKFESALATQCYRAKEYLDCDCNVTDLDPSLEDSLEALPGPALRDALVQWLAEPLRATLPLTQPPPSH